MATSHDRYEDENQAGVIFGLREKLAAAKRDIKDRDMVIDGLRKKLERQISELEFARNDRHAMEIRLANVVKERDYARDQVAKLQRERDDEVDEVEEIKAAWDKTARDLNEEKLARKRDAEDFMRRVKQQEQYFNAKIEGVLHNRDKIATDLRKAEGERHKYRMMYEATQERTSISLGVENGNLRKKINQLQQQKRKWKRLFLKEQVKLDNMTWARDCLGSENRALRDRLTKSDDVKADPADVLENTVRRLEDRVTKIEKALDW